jgi:hypothetical protein
MENYDLFDWFRFSLGWIVTIYASIITLQSLYGWYVWLAGTDKHISLLRRYIITHGLRLRFKTFWGDVLITLLLCVAFLILWRAHHIVYDMEETVRTAHEGREAAETRYAERINQPH